MDTLEKDILKKLVLKKYQCGVGSLEFIQSIIKANEPAEDPRDRNGSENTPDWFRCAKCQEMPREIENKCCGKKNCITDRRKFGKFCLDPENLEMAILSITDLRNDQRDNSTRAFRKAAYRQYVLWQHGYLGKGNRKVVPSCCVLAIRDKYPSPTGVYMGFKEH